MKKTKKVILSLLVAMIILLSAFALMGFTTNASVYADSKTYFSPEKYTESDALLNSDGSESYKNIQTFSNEVKAASIGTSFPELTQVIPRQYLESTQTNATYSYNGKEYGFYVVKEDNHFDVLLIDFVYEFEDSDEHSDIEYKIRIKPLLQQTFLRIEDNGTYEWVKSVFNNYTYYVANPRFMATVQNENALNYGDSGYSKENDDGTIILQFRTNYGKVRYATEEDFWAIIEEFNANQMLDSFIDILDSFTYNLAGTVRDYVELGLDIYETGKETTVLTDNENNIFTQYSKEAQKENPQIEGYSRKAGFMPKEEMILSADDDSYAEFIVVLNDSNYKTRLTQYCEFDIVRRLTNYSSMEHVAGNWYDENAQSLQFSKQRILFEDQEPEFKVTEENVEGDNIPVYLLPNGKQTIAFKPDYSAYYKFDLEDSTGLNLSVIDSNGNAVKDNGYYDLKGGENYNIIVTSGDEKAITSLGISLVDGKSSGTVYAKEQRLVKLNISQSDVYNLSTNNSYCLINDILVKSSRGFINYSEYSGYTHLPTVSVPLQEGEYYVLIYNSSAVNRSFNLGAEECAVGEVGETNTVNTDGMNYVYIKFEIDTGDYIGTILNAENYKVLDYSLESIPIYRLSNGNFLVENNGNVLYIGVLAGEGTTNVLLNLSENSTMWKINGEVVDNNKAELERGNSYEIEFYINGIEQGDTFIFNFNGAPDGLAEAINFTDNTLTIKDYCPTDYSFTVKYYFNALAESISGLEITPVYTVTFEGIDITNDEELTFNWVQTDDLATIYYEVSNGTISCNGSVDTTGYVVGNTYGEDLTQYLSSFGISNVTITISKIDVTTSKGAMAVNLKTPFTAKVHMAYASGSGTKNNPYIISCNRHFENMGINTDADTYFTITKYLKLEGNVIEDFYGIIESKDLVVISWTPEDKQKMGIIINNSGTIRNLQVNVNYNFNLTGLWGHTVGGIVCNNEDSGLIENCSVTMIRASKLNHTTTVGGIAGINNGTINNCYATVDVITGGTFGGIAGINYGTITDSCGMGDIVQKVETYEGCYELSYVGGIAGVNGAGGEISNCVGGTRDDSYLYVIIDVANVDDANLAPYSGPIAGENKGTVKDCSNYGYAIRTGNLHTGSNYNQLRNINNII